MKWQPISEAPKDGRVILAWWNDTYIETIRWFDGEWVWSNDHDSWSYGSGPTHFMPLPPAPEAE